MGEELAVSYLQSKLSSIIKEAESDSGSSSRIIKRIKSLNYDSDLRIPVDGFHELIESVLEWRVFRHTASVSKKGWFDLRKLLLPLSMWMFKRRMQSRLDSIEAKLKKSPKPAPPPARRIHTEQTRPIKDLSHIIGFNADAERIEDWLLPQIGRAAAAWRAVGIVGRCGCGKTALAQKVFASPRIEKEFWPRIWVCFSSNEERVDWRERVLRNILIEIGDDVSSSGVDSYEQLRERLELGLKGKRYMIVLDYACPQLVDKLLFSLLPKESGGAVIVTSRLGKAIGEMVENDPDHLILVEPKLSHEICWQIFCQVFQQQEEKVDLQHIKLAAIQDDLKRNIDRLPLAAKTLGTILPALLLRSCWIRARDIRITWGSDRRYWKWTSLPPPQQEEVAELLTVCWLDIKVTVTMIKFLLKTSYSAYLVFKLNEDSHHLDKGTGRLKIFRDDKLESDQACPLFINYWKKIHNNNAEEAAEEGKEEKVVVHYPQVRGGEEGKQGWMEIKLGEFETTSNDEGRSVEPAFEVLTSDWKSGLAVKGIEIRPSYPPRL